MSELIKQPDTKRPAWRTKAGSAVVGVLMLSGLASGCTAESEPPSPVLTATAPDVAPSTPKPVEVKPTLTPEQERQAALEGYIASEERNTKIDTAVDTLGRRIVRVAESGKIGRFNAYNFETGEWASENPKTSGWVALQHNPQYGGSSAQYSVVVWRTPNGKYDLDKGIIDVKIGTGSQKGIDVMLTASAEGESSVVEVTYNEVFSAHGAESDWYDRIDDFVYMDSKIQSVEDAQNIDDLALHTAEKLLKKDGIK